MTGHVAGILLAAGEGRRFGQPKALVSFGGRRLVERGAATLAAGGCEPVIVVLGAAASEVQAVCTLEDAVVVVNDSWTDGMGSSLKSGLAAARRSGAAAALVLPVDQPVVTPALVKRLIGAWRQGAKAAVAAYRGRGRTPALLDRSLWEAVEAGAVGDMGARGYLRSHPLLVTSVDCDDVGDAADLDTPEDLPKLEEAYERLVATLPEHLRS